MRTVRRFVFLFLFFLFVLGFTLDKTWTWRNVHYLTLGRDGSGSRNEIIVSPLPRANDIFFILRSQERIVRTYNHLLP